MNSRRQRSASQPQKHQQRAVEAQQVVIRQAADAGTKTAARHGADAVGSTGTRNTGRSVESVVIRQTVTESRESKASS